MTKAERSSSEIAAEMAKVRKDRDNVLAVRQTLIEAMERGEGTSEARLEAAGLNVDADVLAQRLTRLEGEHFDATVHETVAGFDALHHHRIEALEVRQAANAAVDDTRARHQREIADAVTELEKARKDFSFTITTMRGYFERQAETSGYGERLKAATDEARERLNRQYGFTAD